MLCRGNTPVGGRKRTSLYLKMSCNPAKENVCSLCTVNLCPNHKPLTALLHNEDLKRSFTQFTVWSHKPEEKHSFKKYTFSERIFFTFVNFFFYRRFFILCTLKSNMRLQLWLQPLNGHIWGVCNFLFCSWHRLAWKFECAEVCIYIRHRLGIHEFRCVILIQSDGSF